MANVSIGSDETRKNLAIMQTDIEDVGKILNSTIATVTEAADSVQRKNPLLNEVLDIFEEEQAEFSKVSQAMDNITATFRAVDAANNEGNVETAEAVAAMRRG